MTSKPYHKLVFILIVILYLVMLTGCFGVEPTLIVITKVRTSTPILPTSTNTAILPTLTETQIPTNTQDTTPTYTPSETAAEIPTRIVTITPTSTHKPALLTLNQDTACFAGPNFGHSLIAYVSEGSTYPILATIEEQSWWFVSLEEEKNCWIIGEYSTIQGADNYIPIITPSLSPTGTPNVSSSGYGIYYILIAKDTGGLSGCGDSLIRYYPGVEVKGDMEDEILAALNALFSNHNQYVDGLYNPIYESRLKAKGVEVVGGDVVVRLGGSFVRPKDKCESQRMHDQIWYTISQFSATRAVVYLNNALLGDLLVLTNK